jgi:general secretion pathway protein D
VFGLFSCLASSSVLACLLRQCRYSVSSLPVISLDIDIADVADLYAWQFDLTFNPAVLAAVSITEGAFLVGGGSTFFLEGTIDNTSGSIAATTDTLIGAISGVTGGGTLATVVFQALASGTSPVTLANVILLDSGLADITGSSTIDGTVNVGASAIPEPATWLMLATGLAGLLGYGRMRRALG